MRKIFVLLLGLSMSLSLLAQNKLQQAVGKGDYIRAKQLLGESNFIKDSIPDIPYYFTIAYIYNAMNNAAKSNENLLILSEMNEIKENPQMMFLILSLKADNYAKLFDYHNAANTYKKIVDNYANVLGEQTLGYKDTWRRYETLKDIKPLSVAIKNSIIPITRNSKGHLEVQVKTASKKPVSLVFDTGASFSAVSESVAKKMNLRILSDSFMMGGAMNNIEYAKIAVADQLHLGNVMYKNVIFYVFKDEHFDFPEENHKINGALGFPEISALPLVKIHNKTNVLEISPAKEQSENSNMMFTSNRQMIISVNDSLLFYLDTGGKWSNLSFNYYNRNKEAIENIGTASTKVIHGLGGSKEFPVYKLTDYVVKVGTTTAILPEMNCFAQPTVALMYEYDGLLGQDIISQYDYTLLDFENMYFALENIKQSK